MPNITKQLADTVTSVGVRAAYGDPVELDGTTIVPVAYAWYGFGGGEGQGEGSAKDEAGAAGSGQGGGGGGAAIPVGAYITRDGLTRFEPNPVTLLAVGIPFVCVAGRALARVIRALKR